MIRRRAPLLEPTFLLAVAIAVGVGFVDGWQMRFVDSIPNLAALFAHVMAVGTAIVVGVLLVVGLVTLVIGGATSGLRVLALAPALVGGVLFGFAIGPTWEYGREMAAHVEVDLEAPISRTFAAAGTCRTEDNGDRIATVQTEVIVDVGGDQLSVFIYPSRTADRQTQLRFVGYHTQGRLADYFTGSSARIDVALEPDAMAGAGAFAGLEKSPHGEPLGGTEGPTELNGRITWRCGS